MEGERIEKRLDATTTSDTQGPRFGSSTPHDVVVFGDPDRWRLICKASSKSQGWMKSTKVMRLPVGCLVQVTTEFRGPNGEVEACAEALTFIPDTGTKEYF